MSSLRFNVGVGDSDFQRGMARIEGAASKTSANIERVFKLAVFKGAYGIAANLINDSVEAYTAKFPAAKAIVDDYRGSLDELYVGIGRDFVRVMQQATPYIKSMAHALEGARESAVNFVSDLLKVETLSGGFGDSAEIDRQTRRAEALDQEFATQKAIAEERKKAIDAARTYRDETFKGLQRSAEDAADPEYAAVRAIRRKYEDALKKMDDLTKGMSQNDQVTSGLFGFRQQLAGFEYAEVNKANEEMGKQRRSARNKDSEGRVAASRRSEQLEDQIAELRIETLRSKKQSELADLLATELNFRQRIREVTTDSAISEQQRTVAVSALNDALDAQRAADRVGEPSRQLSTRGIDAAILGQGGTRQGQFFGGLRGQDPGEQRSARVEDLQKQAVKILGEIERKLPANAAAGGPVIVYDE